MGKPLARTLRVLAQGSGLDSVLRHCVSALLSRFSPEFPRLKRFCTLSPIPGFAGWPEKRAPHLAGGTPAPDANAELLQLCAEYFLGRGQGGERTVDAVARFHLSNGARLQPKMNNP
jgi:malonyl-CoA decarboxylase